MKKQFLLLILLVGCAHVKPGSDSAGSSKPLPPWVVESDVMASEFSKAFGERYPESASALGFNEFDSKGMLVDNTMEGKDRALYLDWQKRINTELKKDLDPELKADLQIFLDFIDLQIEGLDISRKNAEIVFFPASKFVYVSLQGLVNPQSPAVRKKAATDRFRDYVRGRDIFKPLLVAEKEFFSYQMNLYKNRAKFFPFKKEIELYLQESDEYLDGIHELLSISGRMDWENDFATFQRQVRSYNTFVKKNILPKARTDFRLPVSSYTYLLKARGFKTTPEKLISLGESGYKDLYKQFKLVAASLAKKHNLKDSNPVSVVKFFKSQQVIDSEDVEALYKDVSERLTSIITLNELVSLPSAPLKIRLAEEAESKAAPVPHLLPPPLVNNKGERPEFVLPTARDKMPFDDFSHPNVAIVLTAHEGRPGHDLQFSQMLDRGVSMIRSRYAFNNVNVEGWALYAEDLVYSYINEEEQFFALQMRLWRMARAFLDPQLQLGKISSQRVIDLFTKELGVSTEMANLELRRYTFDSPGQAPAYYYGYLLVKEMNQEARKRLGDKYRDMCFNDQLLSYGLLPLSMTAEKMKEDLRCHGLK